MTLNQRGAAFGRLLTLASTTLTAMGLVLVAAGCGSGHSRAEPPAAVSTPKTAPAAQRHLAIASVAGRYVAPAIVATAATKVVPIYRTFRGHRPFRELSNPTAEGAPLVFLVRRRHAGWEQVYLPTRPDGATGWINDRDVTLAYNPYSLEVRLKAHQLVLRKRSRVLARYPAAVGRSVLPTPKGTYYIVDLLKQPDATGPYGPYAFGLSAYSHVLYSFGGGRGQIGIHGTNEATSIGRNQSHGCIRIPNRDISRLASRLPLGTPVYIGT